MSDPLRERLFATGHDWWLLKPSVRAVRLALYVMARAPTLEAELATMNRKARDA